MKVERARKKKVGKKEKWNIHLKLALPIFFFLHIEHGSASLVKKKKNEPCHE